MKHWINNAIFYHIYPLGFCGAPLENTGQGVEYRLDCLLEWIPHLKELGINALYLGPVFESVKHGYDTANYFKIDRRLGDNESFRALSQAFREAGIRVVLDGVFNHVGRNFWAFRDVMEKGSSSPYCDWFYNLNFGGQSPLGDPFWYESWQGHYELVKLNLQNPQVRNHLLEAVRFWMDEFQIHGLRLDTADLLDPVFLRELRETVRNKDPQFWLMGEVIHGDYNRWANPDALDSVTNYECYKGIYSSHNDKNYFEIAHSLARQFGPGGIYQHIYTYNFVENHDVNRIASALRNQNHLRNAYTLLYTMPGVPSVYYGGEWGISGSRTRESDQDLRPCLSLTEMKEQDPGLCSHLSLLSAIRRAFPPLQDGSFENVSIRNELLVYKREKEACRLYIALNLSDREETVEIPHQAPFLQDVLGGDVMYPNQNGRSFVLLPPCSSRLLAEVSEAVDWRKSL